MYRIGEIIDLVLAYYPEADAEAIERAYIYSAVAHRGQLRTSGEAYLSHPLEVAGILAKMRMDVTTIIAGLLHDVPEDTGTSIAAIEEKFGRDVAVLVEGVTKIGKMAFSTKVEREAENFRKMVLAMAKDIRVILIKLADRLHNMRTIDPLPEAKRRRIALETLDIYAPLANRLGIAWMKTELEDLAFRQLHPAEYEDISQRVTKKHQEQEAYIAGVQQLIQTKLADAEVPAEVSGRAKHYYGIWAKMVRQNIPFDQVYDIIAVRVITDSVRNCYAVLGTIHSLWTPVPGRFKDFIAMPKANGYQSLHTTVIGPGGERVEFQIRTRDMHGIAQHGVAAHWKYKEGFKGETRFDDSQKWLKGLLEWQKELKDPREFLETVRVDLFPDEVYAFTPRGDVRALPLGATPVDFAYAVHTDVGHRCVGAKVNGRIVPLRYQIVNGDIIEILTQSGHVPSKDWLKLVRTSRARARIKSWIKTEQRAQSVTLGRELLEKELRKYELPTAKTLKSEEFTAALAALNISAAEDGLRRHRLRQARGAPGREPAPPAGGAGEARRAQGLEDPRLRQTHHRQARRGERAHRRTRRRADALCPVLQPGARRQDHRLHHPGAGRDRARRRLPERRAGAAGPGAPGGGGVGPRLRAELPGAHPRREPRQAGDPGRGHRRDRRGGREHRRGQGLDRERARVARVRTGGQEPRAAAQADRPDPPDQGGDAGRASALRPPTERLKETGRTSFPGSPPLLSKTATL